MKSKIKVAIYVRVSTQEQAKEGYSIQEQIERLTKYCEAMGWEVYKVYTDPGYSGADTNRPGLQAMIKDIRRGRINKVVVYKLDRLSRSQKDTLELIEDEFLKTGVDFVSMNENFDTSTPFGRAIVGILAVFAQLEREQIKERMNMGKEARAKEGKWNGGHHAPIGYDYIDGDLVINNFEAMQVLEAFDLLSKGFSPYKIADILNDKGYKNKNGEWNPKSVRRVLTSKIYIGYLKWGQVWREAQQEPIVSNEMYEEAQRILQLRSEEHEYHQRRKGKATTYLGGYVYCAKCGAKFTKHTTYHYTKSGEKRIYPKFICNSRSKKHKSLIRDINCKNKIWKEEELNSQVFSEIKQLALDPEYITELKKDRSDDNRPMIIQAEIDKLDNKMSKLMDLYVMDSISKDVLQDKLHDMNEQKHSLELDLEKVNLELNEKLTKEEALKIINEFQEVLDKGDFEEIRTVIGELIEKVELDEEDIIIHWNF